MKYNKVEIGERIRKNRKALGYKKQDDFIEALQKIYPKAPKDRGTIGSWENGDNLPDLDTMLAICELFDCDLSYLVGDIEATTRDKQFIMDETGLSEEAVDNLKEYQYAKDPKTYLHFFPELLVIPKFVSFLITYADKDKYRPVSENVLHSVIERIYNIQRTEEAYNSFPKTARKVCEATYFEAQDSLGEEAPTQEWYKNYLGCREHEYREIIKEFPNKNDDEIAEELLSFYWVLDARKNYRELAEFRSTRDLIELIEKFVQTSTALRDK